MPSNGYRRSSKIKSNVFCQITNKAAKIHNEPQWLKKNEPIFERLKNKVRWPKAHKWVRPNKPSPSQMRSIPSPSQADNFVQLIQNVIISPSFSAISLKNKTALQWRLNFKPSGGPPPPIKRNWLKLYFLNVYLEKSCNIRFTASHSLDQIPTKMDAVFEIHSIEFFLGNGQKVREGCSIWGGGQKKKAGIKNLRRRLQK